jgi:hypothetical protein
MLTFNKKLSILNGIYYGEYKGNSYDYYKIINLIMTNDNITVYSDIGYGGYNYLNFDNINLKEN